MLASLVCSKNRLQVGAPVGAPSSCRTAAVAAAGVRKVTTALPRLVLQRTGSPKRLKACSSSRSCTAGLTCARQENRYEALMSTSYQACQRASLKPALEGQVRHCATLQVKTQRADSWEAMAEDGRPDEEGRTPG